MKHIKQTSYLVLQILKEVPEARNNDMRLYYEVCYRKNVQSLGESFGYVIMNLKSLKLPPFESVRRARQKWQRVFRELRSDKQIERERKANEIIMKQFAKGVY